jgi:hypothetical protein
MGTNLIVIDQEGAAEEIPRRPPTIADLVDAFRTDPVSSYHGLRYHVRVNHNGLLRRMRAAHGHIELRALKARHIKALWQGWAAGGKIATGHTMIGQLRALVNYGADMLEDPECERLCGVLHRQRFPGVKPRKEIMTAAQVIALRNTARRYQWPMIALGQALQFELIVRQKDVIGEWIPDSEPGESDIGWDGWKWQRGMRWEEVDHEFILRHTTSKKGKDIEVDLKHDAPMVAEELCLMAKVDSPRDLRRDMFYPVWPIILCGWTGLPYTAAEYRRKWRIIANACGVPAKKFNMDNRASGISEAFAAGAIGDDIRVAATHSSITQTEDYNRGNYRKRQSRAAQARIASRGNAS